MNNKKLGTDFENKVCFLLAAKGYWVHFIVPDARGAQPFDIIAVRNGTAYAIDCKTCVSNIFSISRLEENQVRAFELWMKRGNNWPLIVVEHKDDILVIPYPILRGNGGKIRIGGKHGKDETVDCGYIRSFDNFFN